MAAETRHSLAAEPQIISDPDLLAKQETLNGLRQFDLVMKIVDQASTTSRKDKIRPSQLLQLHRAALEGISVYAGNWRPAGIAIDGSGHQPVEVEFAAEEVENLCDYVNEHWDDRSAVHLASYVMWRLNWIHPFSDGNGRTSRAASYLVLCLKMGTAIPGQNTIPDQIASDKTPYYKALEAADRAWQNGEVNLSDMETLLESMLAKQLWTFLESASTAKDEKSDSFQTSN